MLSRQQRLYFQFLQTVDALLLCAALWLSHWLRLYVVREFPLIELAEIVGPFSNYMWLLIVILPVGPLILEMNGFYRFNLRYSHVQSFFVAVRSTVLLFLILLALLFVLRVPQEQISRGVFILYVPLAIAALMLREHLFQYWLAHRGKSSIDVRHVMLCGTADERAQWRKQLEELPGRPYQVRTDLDLTALNLEDFLLRLHEESIDIAIFSLDHSFVGQVRDAIVACETEGVEAWVTADFFRTSLAKPQFDRFHGQPLLVFRSTPDASWQLFLKRFIDCTAALAALVLLSPLLLGVGLLILVFNGRPVLFVQKRSGRYGRPFTMYKFRTMITDAEQKQEELADFNQMSGPVFKMEKDPRVTGFGNFLRRTSLDEFPQLWNVLKGEMSLVGPRPLPLKETQGFSDRAQRRRMSVRPGLTCLWQIAGRNEIKNFEDWVRLDLEYIDHWSFWLDIKILLKTIPIVLLGRGAK
jgi:exopolysaccharide biosynthesis polyprenyl glycosylphosphotransferase